MKIKLQILTAIFLTTFTAKVNAQSGDSKKLDLKVSPDEIGQRIVDNIVNRRFGWRYQKVCTYYGALIFADATGNSEISKQLTNGYSKFLNGKKKPHSGHVDYNVFGIWPFEIYRQTGNEEYLAIPKKLADDEFANPREDGLTELTRFWVDDMRIAHSIVHFILFVIATGYHSLVIGIKPKAHNAFIFRLNNSYAPGQAFGIGAPAKHIATGVYHATFYALKFQKLRSMVGRKTFTDGAKTHAHTYFI